MKEHEKEHHLRKLKLIKDEIGWHNWSDDGGPIESVSWLGSQLIKYMQQVEAVVNDLETDTL